MSDKDESPAKLRTELVYITVLRMRYLRGVKGEHLTITIRSEFADKLIGESQRLECTFDKELEPDYSVSFFCSCEDSLELDEIAHKPVILTLTEIVTKEKKQKEEKFIKLGQCTIDLLPLILGKTEVECTLKLHSFPGSPWDSSHYDGPKPEADVKISVDNILYEQPMSNLMAFTVESLYSPPESWSNTNHTYVCSFPLPVNAEKETLVVFGGGQLKPGIEKEFPNKQKKWFFPGSAQGDAVYIPGSCSICDEDGELKSKEDREHRNSAEREKVRITWNIEKRCFLEPSAVQSFEEKITKCKYWPVEVFRVALPNIGRGKKDEEGVLSFYGLALLNLAPFLYPGVKNIRGAYRILPFTESCLYTKTGREKGNGTEAARIAFNLFTKNVTTSHRKGKEGTKEPKKVPGQMSRIDATIDSSGPISVNLEGQHYLEANSYIMLEISLDKPLIPKRTSEELSNRVSEYIPSRPLFPKRTGGAQRAIEDYHKQVSNVAALLLDEFRELFGQEPLEDKAQTEIDIEERRQKMIYELTSSGKYFAFKEQLKHAVVKIVREKYLKTTNFEDRHELEAFLSELYIYLVDEMHVALGEVLSLEDQPPIPKPIPDVVQLKHFAREAELNGNIELATRYYQERITRNKNEAEFWFDYGVFCLFNGDLTKCEECLRECISISPNHVSGLLLFGLLCSMTGRKELAETFLETATTADPKSPIPWTIIGLFYEEDDNEIKAEMSYVKANKLIVASAKEKKCEEELEKKLAKEAEEIKGVQECQDEFMETKEVSSTSYVDVKPPVVKIASRKSDRKTPGGKRAYHAPTTKGSRKKSSAISHRTSSIFPVVKEEETPRESTPVPAYSIFMQAADWLLEVKAMSFTERALAHELLQSPDGPEEEYHLHLAQLKIQRNELEEAEISLNKALMFSSKNPDTWAILGHVKYLGGNAVGAQECYEHALAFVNDAQDMHPVYLRLGSIYLQDGKFLPARNTFLLACKSYPSSVSWLGVGIACYRMEEISEAEDALAEANILNNMDPEVWAYLSLVCLRTSRRKEAEQSYKYALKLGLQDEDLLNEISQFQQQVGFGDPQF